MKKLNRGDRLYLDEEKTIKSDVNLFLACRDGIIEVYEYLDSSGYGSQTRIFLCEDTKHESIAIIRQTKSIDKTWKEETMYFDTDSFKFLKGLIVENSTVSGGTYTVLRNYMNP